MVRMTMDRIHSKTLRSGRDQGGVHRGRTKRCPHQAAHPTPGRDRISNAGRCRRQLYSTAATIAPSLFASVRTWAGPQHQHRAFLVAQLDGRAGLRLAVADIGCSLAIYVGGTAAYGLVPS